MTSYRYKLIVINSCFVVDVGQYTLVKVSDCKIFGLTMHNLLSSHPQIDFVFKSYIYANNLNYCNKDFHFVRSVKKSVDNVNKFLAFSNLIRVKYAISF